MKKNDHVVYTCLFGFSEKLQDTEYNDHSVDYICFTDNPELRSDIWKIQYINPSKKDPSRVSKKFKHLPFVALSNYKKSIYIDNTAILKSKPSDIFDELSNEHWVMLRHPWEDCAYKEAEAVIAAAFDDPAIVRLQMQAYRAQGYPEHNGLNAGTFILRDHHDGRVKHLGVEWYSHIIRYSRRDQLSWNYCAWRNGFEFRSLDEDLRDNRFFSWPNCTGPRLPRDFDDRIYLALHPDVAQAGLNPRRHYLDYGIAEGRAYKPVSPMPVIIDSAPPEPDQPEPMRLTGADRPNDRHSTFADNRTVTIRREQIIASTDRIFTMGSCFAEEIRKALGARGWACLPEYSRIAFDPADSVVDTLPDREHMNFYNTFTVLLQLQQILGLWKQDRADHWTVARISKDLVPFSQRPVFQDPYRRFVFAASPEKLSQLIDRIVAEMRRSFDEATAFVFTFGMTEVFINRASGKAAAQKPAYAGGGGLSETVRHDSTFEENLENVREIVRLIRRFKGEKVPIIMSVSPVPLARTFSDRDVVTANGEGKAILRAVLGQIEREFEEVRYLPSYEFVTTQGFDAYEPDLRHVRADAVASIVAGFLEGYTGYRKRHIYIDLGSNHGITIEKFRNENPDAIIYGFEPAAQLAQELREKFGADENIHIVEGAAWIEDGTVTFYPGGPSDESSTLLTGKSKASPWTVDYENGYSVPSIDIGRWLHENTTIDDTIVMKMDIEGAEYKILPRLMESGSVSRLHELRVEWHWDRYPDQVTEADHHKIRDKLKALVKVVDWH